MTDELEDDKFQAVHKGVSNALRERASAFQEAGFFSSLKEVRLRLVGWILEKTSLAVYIAEVCLLKSKYSAYYYQKSGELVADLVRYHRYRTLAFIFVSFVKETNFEVEIEDIDWLNRFRGVCSTFEKKHTKTDTEIFRDVLVLGRWQIQDMWYVLTVRRTTEGFYTNVYVYKPDERFPKIWRNDLYVLGRDQELINLSVSAGNKYCMILNKLDWSSLLIYDSI